MSGLGDAIPCERHTGASPEQPVPSLIKVQILVIYSNYCIRNQITWDYQNLATMITIFCRMQCSTPPSPPSPSLLYPSYRAPPPGVLASKTILQLLHIFFSVIMTSNNFQDQQQCPPSPPRHPPPPTPTCTCLRCSALYIFMYSRVSYSNWYSHMHMSQIRFITLLYARAVNLICIVEKVIQLDTPTYRYPRLEFQLFMHMRSAHGPKVRCAQCPS